MSTDSENKQDTKAVKPELLGGFRDLLPAEAIMRQEVIEKVRQVYEQFGFVPLETPGMEKLETLVGKDTKDFNKSLFVARVVRGTEDKQGVDVGTEVTDFTLRFDLTVPLARVVAAYPELGKPFKRYQIGQVWRGEKPQAGRFREFGQFDFDIVGARSILADVEVIQMMYEAMRALGIEKFLIKINTRKLLNDMVKLVGCADKAKEVFRIIDKFDKIGADGVKAELQREPDNQFDESAIALSEEMADKVISFLEIADDNPNEVLNQLQSFFGEEKSAGVAELKSIVKLLNDLGIPGQFWQLDISVARGLDYYTGPVFETILTDMPKLGSVLSGGRFDGLVDRFMPGSNIPGVGASVGIDRLLVGMEKLGLIEKRDSLTQVLVTVFDTSNPLPAMKFATKLREQGIKTEVYLALEEDRGMRAQIAYAVKKDMPFAVIIGPEEIDQNKVALKDLIAHTQETLTEQECIDKILAAL